MCSGPSDRVIRVMILDGRPIAREGLRAVMNRAPDLVVVAQVATVDEARDAGVSPDVIIAALDLPDATRENMTGELRRLAPRTSILVLAPLSANATVQNVLATGADSYLLETAESSDILEGIRTLAAGKTYLQPALGVQLARVQPRSKPAPELSLNEERLLGLLALGHTNAEVAHLCGVSLRTVEARRARLRQTLGRHTRAELVEYARAAGLL